ncbi:hypothetical protein HII28_00380 [Planctomonas sp. JC2975]|uniref:hypothetical protein n=1 Tax=Planctomonas sp. JC2975 TaxID=2729626 RepID=UPI00147339EB|nr:hypothetical protein [Planctomonas sp. JC2975]NNC10341.1 hypothetical protein [Planctomonas sp. JC2975]
MPTSLLSVSTKTSEALDATVKGLQLLDKNVQTQIRQETKLLGQEEWTGLVARHLAGDSLQSTVLGETSKLQFSNQNVMLQSGASTRRMTGGATPAELARQEEFGANRNRLTAYRRRTRKGKTQQIIRHTTHPLMPIRRNGWTVYPAAAEFIPRIASLWVQTFMRTVYEAFEGKSN